jgi:hypothetical protein
MNNSDKPPEPITPRPIAGFNRLRMAMDHNLRIRLGLVITVGGFLVFMVGCHPALIGMDRSMLVGVVQVVVLLVGLLVICLGGYVCVVALWKGQPLSIPADIGLRLIGTGYVIAFFSGFADVFGLGTHKPPNIPFFGPWQARGVIGGEIVIIIGFLMVLPLLFTRPQPAAAETAVTTVTAEAGEATEDPENQDKPITLNIS